MKINMSEEFIILLIAPAGINKYNMSFGLYNKRP